MLRRPKPGTSSTVHSSHRIIDARSLALHCLVVRKIERDPRLLGIAQRNLSRWLRRYTRPPPALIEWQALLARPWPDVAAILTEMTEDATRLRQSSPFAGVLTQTERRRIYDAFRLSDKDPAMKKSGERGSATSRRRADAKGEKVAIRMTTPRRERKC
jgi:hypothetical protein